MAISVSLCPSLSLCVTVPLSPFFARALSISLGLSRSISLYLMVKCRCWLRRTWSSSASFPSSSSSSTCSTGPPSSGGGRACIHYAIIWSYSTTWCPFECSLVGSSLIHYTERALLKHKILFNFIQLESLIQVEIPWFFLFFDWSSCTLTVVTKYLPQGLLQRKYYFMQTYENCLEIFTKAVDKYI